MRLTLVIFPVALAIAVAVASASIADEITPMTPAAVAEAEASPEVVAGREAMSDPRRDAEALASFMKAAGQGNPIAETYLGYLHYMGHGVPQDDRAAADWYRRAAERGFGDAQLRLGIMYLYGRELAVAERSLTPDEQEGMSWMRHAAESGNPIALDMIADGFQAPFSHRLAGYLSGHLSADEANPTEEEVEGLHKAVELYRRAAEQNDRYAIVALCSLRAFLVPMPADIPKWCEMADQPPSSPMASAGPYVSGVNVSILSSDEIPLKPHCVALNQPARAEFVLDVGVVDRRGDDAGDAEHGIHHQHGQ